MDAARLGKREATSAPLRRDRSARSRASAEARRSGTQRCLAYFLGLAALALGCSKDPAREEAARLERDRTHLNQILEADLKAEHALTEVGEAEKKQKDDEAAALIETNALPATEAAIALARAATPETAWGRTRRDEMLAAMNDRKDELPRYAAALRAHDMEAELTSVQKQIDIERRAMSAAKAIQDGPGAASAAP